MEPDHDPPTPTSSTTATITTTTTTTGEPSLSPPSPSHDYDDDDEHDYIDDSNCSTPYVSAPSSPGRSFSGLFYAGAGAGGFYYSAPTSPMHYVLSNAAAGRSSAVGGLAPAASDASSNGSFEFEFSARFDSPAAPEIGSSMSSADELFLNGQIRPMKLSAHLQRPQPPLASFSLLESERSENEADDNDDDVVFHRSRDLRFRDRSQRSRRTRSLSPLRSTTPFDWFSDDVISTPKKSSEERENTENGGAQKSDDNGGDGGSKEAEGETTPSGSSSRCSSAGRSSKRWVFLKDFLRSKSEGRSNNKFWHNISFSPAKEKREKVSSSSNSSSSAPFFPARKGGGGGSGGGKETPAKKSAAAPAGKRRSAHEMHYAANRAQAEEMRKKTFLPYRQGLLGCLGFNSKSYGALNGFARALNPVSSR